MDRKVTLYDLASKMEPQSWSPNCWKARYVLNYKNLPYETVYVSYSDIAKLWQTLGLSLLPGFPSATLPVISVSSSDGGPPTVIVDSFEIALFLDHEFPHSPTVIPANTAALQASWVLTLRSQLIVTLPPFVVPNFVHKLDDQGAEYFRRTREQAYGMKLEELYPTGEKRDQAVETMRGAFNKLNDMLNANGAHNASSKDWVMGSIGPTFADFALGGILTWVKMVAEPEVWSTIAVWNGGRWAQHLEKLQNWHDTP